MLTSTKPIVAVAPMMDYTDRHFRYLLRLLSPHLYLYTEMVTTGALIYGDRHRFLQFNEIEHPVALQLGGSSPNDLAQCAKRAEEYGYDEINLNVGCPSARVQSGSFGACLMAEPELVAECVAAMRNAVKIPVTVKTRIGINEQDSEVFLHQFVETVAEAGCDTFIIHARKAWLNGLSPKENREIPLLNYDRVYQLKKIFPHLHIVINGGIKTHQEIQRHLQHVDGVMLGRVAYEHTYLFSEIEDTVFQTDAPLVSRYDVVTHYIEYAQHQIAQGVPVRSVLRHLLGLFHQISGGKRLRRTISEFSGDWNALMHTFEDVLD